MRTRGARAALAEAVTVAVAAAAAADARGEGKVHVGSQLHHRREAVFGRNSVELSQWEKSNGGADGEGLLQLLLGSRKHLLRPCSQLSSPQIA